MKNLKTTILKACIIALMLQPMFSNAQTFTVPISITSSTNPQITIFRNDAETASQTPAEIVFNRTGGSGVPATQKAAVGVDGLTSRNFYLWVNGADRLNIDATGKVGIGTTSPSEQLEVNGNIKSTSLGGYLNLENFNAAGGSGTQLIFGHNQGSPTSGYNTPLGSIRSVLISGGAGSGRSGYLAFQTTYSGVQTDRLSIDQTGVHILNGGSLTIGPKTPTGKIAGSDYLLAVAGQIYAQEVDVTPSTSWSDYVFKSDYKLATLSDVEKYIEANGHLENVPSAEEVAKNGFKLGEMDATLLRKIEELTLYILAQEKRIKELETAKK